MKEANLDTNILKRYINDHLPVDDACPSCVNILESGSTHCVIGGQVHSEFRNLCGRHSAIYKDILNWCVKNEDRSVYEYDLVARDVYHNSNDKEHIRYDVQCAVGGKDLEEVLSDLRHCIQGIDRLQNKITDNLIDKIYDSFENDDLRSRLDSDLCYDRDVVVDAVEIQKKDDIDVLVSCDPDLHDNGNSINNTICSVENDDCTLTIMHPSRLSDNL